MNEVNKTKTKFMLVFGRRVLFNIHSSTHRYSRRMLCNKPRSYSIWYYKLLSYVQCRSDLLLLFHYYYVSQNTIISRHAKDFSLNNVVSRLHLHTKT